VSPVGRATRKIRFEDEVIDHKLSPSISRSSSTSSVRTVGRFTVVEDSDEWFAVPRITSCASTRHSDSGECGGLACKSINFGNDPVFGVPAMKGHFETSLLD
jgi:hypothetical protein